VWPAVFVLAGSVAGARLGAAVSRRTKIHLLRVVLAGLIAVSAIRVWLSVLFE
jgi:uncharacterized protein